MKKKRLFSNIILTGSWVLLSCACGEAQAPFAWHADLDTVKQAAFYRITLPPELIAKCRPDLGDLRIRDRDNKFVPYVLRSVEPGPDAYQDIPDPVIRQKDSSDRHSYITLKYPESYRIDKLTLEIQGPRLYKRRAQLYDNDKINGWPIAAIDIDPVHTSFAIPSLKTHSLLLDITNADNAPLVISRAATAQLDQYLLIYLQPGGAYQLLAGSPSVGPPDYDLKYFVDSLTRDPEGILMGPLQINSLSVSKPGEPAVKDHSGIILWSIILLVLVLLVSLSFKLVKATVKKDKG
ncbi:MAG TPA: hypothetical protein VNS58_21965 [Puia sp.]|nr:hypothetical protein [Puia sp.]